MPLLSAWHQCGLSGEDRRDEPVSDLQQQLWDTYARILLLHPTYAMSKRLDHKLWLHFYRLIEVLLNAD